MHRQLIVFASCLLLALTTLRGADMDRLQFYYNLAEGNYLIGDLGGAQVGVEQSLRINPDHAPSLALKAKILLDQSKGEAALEASEKAIQADPDNFENQILRALILGNLNRRAEALAQIDSVLKEAEPSSQDAKTAQHLKGLLNMANQRWDDAAAAFKETYENNPKKSDQGRQLAAEAYMEKARTAPNLDEALNAIDQALALYSSLSGLENVKATRRLKLTRAKLLARGGSTKEAVQALQLLVTEEYRDLESTVTLASIYASEENWEALEGLIEPIAENPRLLDVALYLEGRIALSRDRVGTARAKFEEALEINAGQPSALQHALEFYRSICLERLERYDQAEKSFLKAIEGSFAPESPAETVHTGRLLLRMGELDTMIPIMEKALLGGSENAEGWALLGRAHLRKKQNALAISAFNQSLSIDPEQMETLALRGSLLREIGDPEGALVDYKRAQELAPSSPVLSYEAGLVLLRLGRIEEAEEALEIAARKLNTHVTLDLLHASCAYTIGDYESSAQSLSEYLTPSLEGEALERFQSNLSDTATYLQMLLSAKKDIGLPARPELNDAGRLFASYASNQATRKELLDQAGIAETPKEARQQICSTAFWMAQHELAQEENKAAKELLQTAIATREIEQPEFQFAKWQLNLLQK